MRCMPDARDSNRIRFSGHRKSWLSIVLIVVAALIWIYEQQQTSVVVRRDPPAIPIPSPPETKPRSTKSAELVGGYEVYQNCKWVDAKRSDGDSFIVELPDGRRPEFRLYFVDAPESGFKTYRPGVTNHQRISEQANQLGLTPQQAVEIGVAAKQTTRELLESRPFTLFTCWDSPFNDDRYHAFVQIDQGTRTEFLEEILVTRGLVRIHTKSADLPDGTKGSRYRSLLLERERAAKKAQVGAWGK